MSNLLLITDVARLQNVFGRLVEDETIRLRVVNTLEMGGDEIAIEKPDVVFVQTHLSGLSADILLKHLKKQLGRKRSRFVLLAAPSQTTDAVVKTYQGWLDTSQDEGQIYSGLRQLLENLCNKSKKNDGSAQEETDTAPSETPQAVSSAESSALLGRTPIHGEVPPQPEETGQQFPVVPAAAEPTLEEQGITYAPRQRMTVYSEFNSSFDSAVSSTPEPERLEQAAAPPVHDWRDEDIDIVESARPAKSKKSSFLLWLVPVVIVVVVVTFLQQQKSSLVPETPTVKTVPPASVKPPVQTALPAPVVAPAQPEPVTAAVTAPTVGTPATQNPPEAAAPQTVVENRPPPAAAPPAPTVPRMTKLPGFIPLQGMDKQFGATHPGWEKYADKTTEFKVFREAQAVKALQVIDRGGEGIPEPFMRSILLQVSRSSAPKIEVSEKKDGYEIQRGRVADNIRVVYYRDEDGKKLRAFVLTWR